MTSGDRIQQLIDLDIGRWNNPVQFDLNDLKRGDSIIIAAGNRMYAAMYWNQNINQIYYFSISSWLLAQWKKEREKPTRLGRPRVEWINPSTHDKETRVVKVPPSVFSPVAQEIYHAVHELAFPDKYKPELTEEVEVEEMTPERRDALDRARASQEEMDSVFKI